MSRGKSWSEEEIKALTVVMDKFPDLMPTALARVCKGLYICPTRTESAIRERFRWLKRGPEEEEEAVQTPIEENVENVYKDLYEGIIGTIFRNASLYTKGYDDDIFIHIPSLRKWLLENEADRYYDKLNELVGARYIYQIPDTGKEGNNGRMVQNPERHKRSLDMEVKRTF